MLKNFKKFAGNFFKNRHGASESKEINPRRDWNIIMFSFVFIMLTIVVFSSYVYWRINRGGFSVVSPVNELPIETIDRSELKKAIKHYEDRKNLFQEIKSKKPEVVDPSQ